MLESRVTVVGRKFVECIVDRIELVHGQRECQQCSCYREGGGDQKSLENIRLKFSKKIIKIKRATSHSDPRRNGDSMIPRTDRQMSSASIERA